MNPSHDLRAVVFDLDGLIANTEDLYEKAGEAVLARRGKTYDAALREQMMGRPVADALQIMIDCHSLSDTLEALMCECKDEMLAARYDVARSDAGPLRTSRRAAIREHADCGGHQRTARICPTRPDSA